MIVFSFIKDIFDSVGNILDDITTTDEERNDVKMKIQQLQAAQMAEALKYESSLLKAQSTIIKAEASGSGWLQTNWRPITMLTFLVLIICDVFNLLSFRLADEAWQLLQIGIGGYVVGRSVEKIAPALHKIKK